MTGLTLQRALAMSYAMWWLSFASLWPFALQVQSLPVLNKCAFRIANKISPVEDFLAYHCSAVHSAVEYIDNTLGVNQSTVSAVY